VDLVVDQLEEVAVRGAVAVEVAALEEERDLDLGSPLFH
jgi:hypothetical protein